MYLTFAMFLLYFLLIATLVHSFVTPMIISRPTMTHINCRKHTKSFVFWNCERSICLFDMNRAIDRYIKYLTLGRTFCRYLHLSMVAVAFHTHANFSRVLYSILHASVILEKNETRGGNVRLSGTVGPELIPTGYPKWSAGGEWLPRSKGWKWRDARNYAIDLKFIYPLSIYQPLNIVRLCVES